ncbi:hypothetical protein ABI59_14140 [Acidobacteria bacterium Mor1]|nr:hypothetical protein ABI59_14140 [Acidobacteria bacterium Mor1]
MHRTTVRIVALVLCLLVLSTAGHTARLIEAQAVDGTYCAGALVACGADATLLRWFKGSSNIPYWVNEDAAADAGASPITQADIINGTQAAFQAWEDVPFAIIKFAYQGETTARIAADGINTTLFFDPVPDTAACAGSLGAAGGTLAVTILTENLPEGEIIDADIVFDSADSWELSLDCTNFDFQSTQTHEVGHGIGIHHTEASCIGSTATRPTMCGGYFCTAGQPGSRTLEPDDQAAAQCLYPEQPTTLLIDQTGSMNADSRMDDAKETANAYIDDFADNVISVTAFAESAGCAPARDGYELLEDWTDDVVSLQAAVNATSPCGGTPMWESMCCAIGKAAEIAPSNVFMITDRLENASDNVCSADCPAGYCGGADSCTDAGMVAEQASADGVTFFIIDMGNYSGTSLGAGDGLSGDGPSGDGDGQDDFCNTEIVDQESQDLAEIARISGGYYCAAFNRADLDQARRFIQRRMAEDGLRQQNPVTCSPSQGSVLIDDIQAYDVGGSPNSPFDGQQVQIRGVVTVAPGTYDANTRYVQDCSGGIQVLASGAPAALGDEVVVNGTVSDILGEIRLSPVSSFTQRDVSSLPRLPIQDPADGLIYETIGSLMRVQGFVAGPVANFRFNLVSDLGLPLSQSLTVFIDPDTGIDTAGIVPGELLTVTGVVTRRLGQNELKPRNQGDVVDAGTPGESQSMVVTGYNKATGEIQVSYGNACDATSHTIYSGPLSQVGTYGYDQAFCGLGLAGNASFNPGPGSHFFLVAGENGNAEGTYGLDSQGNQRPEDVGTPGCDRPQELGNVVCQ